MFALHVETLSSVKIDLSLNRIATFSIIFNIKSRKVNEEFYENPSLCNSLVYRIAIFSIIFSFEILTSVKKGHRRIL